MKRRDLLAALAAVPLAAFAGRLFAAPQAGAKLLVMSLRGGYDAASLLVPADGVLDALRPTVAVPAPGRGEAGAAALDTDWGLHPSLAASMLPRYRAGELAFVPFAGGAHCHGSHADAQRAVTVPTGVGGCGGEFLDRLAWVLSQDTRAVARPSAEALFAGARGEPGRCAHVSGVDAVSGDAWSTTTFAGAAADLAGLMADRVDIGMVEVGGWDTHVDQGAATGYLADRFAELGNGLECFAQRMGAAWGRTVVVVVSEFGRTLRENGNRGTDHGHGTAYWVLGGGICGGRMLGAQRRLDAASIAAARALPVLNEHREVLGGLFQQMYGLNAAQLRHVFPDAARGHIRFV